uniref:Uncharacterized protein n=1 Tax=Rhizophora mucronata TaxID=61149 RepID=A0A2P2N634_RHIMU
MLVVFSSPFSCLSTFCLSTFFVLYLSLHQFIIVTHFGSAVLVKPSARKFVHNLSFCPILSWN